MKKQNWKDFFAVLIVFGAVAFFMHLIGTWMPKEKPNHYRLQIQDSFYFLRDGDRTVGTFKFGDNPKLDSAIINDNL